MASAIVATVWKWVATFIASEGFWAVFVKRLIVFAAVSFVAKALVELVIKTVPNFNFVSFLGNMAPNQHWETKYTNNKEYNLRICWVCLYQYLSILTL